LRSPMITTTQPIYDAGRVVGAITINHSLAELTNSSAIVLGATSIVAFVTFFFLRTFPLSLLARATNQAKFLASHDPLTNLPNRALFNEWLVHSLYDMDRQQGALAVLCLDLDHFKEVNDVHGHAAGDMLLRQATDRMMACVDSGDMLARLGGDEFAIIQKLVDVTSAPSALAECVLASLSEPYALETGEVVVGASVGISIRNAGDKLDGQTMLRQADMALYRAKEEGRGAFRYFENDMNEALIARKRIEANLRTAITQNELELHYQPQIDLSTNTIKGVEALLRWNQKDDGMIPPDAFVPLAEECGLIVPLGDWVIGEACRQAKEWPDLTFAVNVSPAQFRQGDLVATVKNALEREGIDPSRLEIEITEGVLLSHTDETIAVLAGLQAMGVKIAMDDFGTGYSSLSYLRRFPFDKIKIDKSFTMDLGLCADADNIIEAVIKLGASMGMTSNAEGVETVEQANLLRNQGCKEVQGFLFSKPLPSKSISELLTDWQWQKYQNVESSFSKQERPC
ncbi:MAG: bifunctional diguanylate cyclase/phosphodiesterase, partial [Paracoccaceae bacterium]